MKLPPAAVLASFPLPNYTNPKTRGESLIIVNAVFLGLTTLVVILRLFTRLVVRRWFGWDDVFIVLAFVSAFSFHLLFNWTLLAITFILIFRLVLNLLAKN
jgi:hypothetical protein